MFLRRLRTLAVWLLSAVVKRLYRIVFLLRLYVLLLERDAARAANNVSSREEEQDQARWQQRVDDGGGGGTPDLRTTSGTSARPCRAA